MLEMYPLADVIKQALRGTGECAEVHWRFLGASIAEWSLIWFLLIAGSFTIYLWRLLTIRQT
jgi:disulfide bond formation protein DsbB